MNSFTFSLMLLLQRADEALRRERLNAVPDRQLLGRLDRQRRRIAARLRRSFTPIATGC